MLISKQKYDAMNGSSKDSCNIVFLNEPHERGDLSEENCEELAKFGDDYGVLVKCTETKIVFQTGNKYQMDMAKHYDWVEKRYKELQKKRLTEEKQTTSNDVKVLV